MKTQQEIEDFLKNWEPQLKQVFFILHYLHSYPDVLERLKILDLIQPEKLIMCQSDWIRLCEAFKGTPEEYYQPYWVPVNDGFDYFIDLSDENLGLFEVFFDYIDEEDMHYRKIEVFKSISEIMTAEDYNTNLESIRINKIWDKYGRYLSNTGATINTINPHPLC